MLLRELKDPGFAGMVSVSAVRASDDGSFATVYVTMLGAGAAGEATEEEKIGALTAFEKAKGLIRHEIGKRLGLRHTPDLRFKFDTSEEYGRHIEKLISELKAAEPSVGKMNTVEEIADALGAAGSVRIFPHENLDGDAVGSAVALCLALREKGKDCLVVVNEKMPDNIAFIEYGCVVCIPADGAEDEGADGAFAEGKESVSVLIDVGETERIPGREDLFACGDRTMCIDHHASSRPLCDYNLIDSSVSAVGEIVYDIVRAMGATISERVATALYVAIVTDTGRFQYANTTAHSLRTAAELLDAGVSPNEVSSEIYQNVRQEKIMLENEVMATMEMVSGGKGVIAYMTGDMLSRTGALEEETEGIAEKLRGIRGVEVSVFMREAGDRRTKASMRSKFYYDVGKLAARFGGGGHLGAAGFTSERPLDEVVGDVKRALEETL
jgi:phosphoesterase RecJ-like protein